jgi:hypothetical protein
MIRSGEILNAVKTILDADSTLDTLLDVGDFGKTVLGPELPESAGLPVINLVDLTNFVTDIDTKMSEMVVGVVIRCYNSEYDRPDYDTLDDISARVNTLLDDETLTLTNNQFCACYFEDVTPVSPDFDRSNASIQQVRFRVHGI